MHSMMTGITDTLRAFGLALSLVSFGAVSAEPTLLVLDFEFIESMHDPRTVDADQNRLLMANEELRQQLASCLPLTIIDPAPAEAAITLARSRVMYLHQCNGCGEEIGRAANATYVLLPWIQKVSNLILNINAEIRDVESDTVAAVRSVDLRGNTDRGWLRGTKALANRLCELDGERLSRSAHP
jgi:hypothetical protein